MGSNVLARCTQCLAKLCYVPNYQKLQVTFDLMIDKVTFAVKVDKVTLDLKVDKFSD